MNTQKVQKTIITTTPINKAIEIHTHFKKPEVEKKPEELFDEDDLFDESDIEVRNILLKIKTPAEKYQYVGGEQSVVKTALFTQSNPSSHRRYSFH